MRRKLKWFVRTPRRSVFTAVVVLALVMSTTALAAWIIFTGATGSGGATVGSSTINNAVTLTPSIAGIDATLPGHDGEIRANVTNLTSSALVLNTLTAGTITASPACNTSGLSVVNPQVPMNLSASQVRTGIVIASLHAAANLDPACANSTITIAFTGTTTP